MLHFPKLTYRYIQREAKRIKQLLDGNRPKLTSNRATLEAYIADWQKEVAKTMAEYAPLIRKLRGKREPISA
ncbi:MAG: hypothetical protein J7647_30885 [Cyanobacteria bacterium SBLK]|nr:hypothetical protein [Cyanobacteria bacterium SBLK]